MENSDMQQKFEAWMAREMSGFDLSRRSEPDMGDYEFLDTEDCWRAYAEGMREGQQQMRERAATQPERTMLEF